MTRCWARRAWGSVRADASRYSRGSQESGGSELVLYQRMGEVREAERRLSVEDVMYLCVVEKFVSAGVDLLPPLDGMVDLPPGEARR